MIRSTSPRAIPEGFVPGQISARDGSLETQVRFLSGSYDADTHTFEAVLTAGTGVRRWGIVEELAVSPEAVDLARLASCGIPLLDSHDQSSTGTTLGTLVDTRFEGAALVGRFRFAETDEARRAEGMVQRGELKAVSVGYAVRSWRLVSVDEAGLETWRAERWELLEVSLVSVPADPLATVRSAAAPQPDTARPVEGTDDMRRSIDVPGDQPAVTQPTPTPTVTPPAAPETRAAPPEGAALAAERTRAAAIHDIGRRSGLAADEVARAITEGTSLEDFRARAFDALAARASSQPVSGIVVERDEGDTRRRAIGEALAVRLNGGAAPQLPGRRAPEAAIVEAARGYMDWSIVDLAADVIGHRGRIGSSFAAREELLRAAFHTTSDFPIILSGALNTVLAARYAVQAPTYRRIARQRSYRDFRDHAAIRVGDFPQLKPVAETGELTDGTFGESKEKTAVKAYGVKIAFSRQLLVNDDLGAIQQILADQAGEVARFEDRTFYAMAFANPSLLETGRQVWNATDKTLAAAGAAISTASLSLGRAAMRKQKRFGSTEEIDVAPTILLVGPDKETEAAQVLERVQATQAANVAVFSGRLEPISTAKITGNAWYLFADPSVLPCFEWGLLDGYTAPRMRMDDPFGTQGVSYSLEHDFGCGAIDFRGTYKNAGD